jgi:hypothetical protein
MARFITVMVLMAVASFIAIMCTFWWIPMPIAFILILLLPMKSARAFLSTALGTAITYIILSIKADMANQHILSTKMATLFHMPSFAAMIVLTALIGFITAGLGGWCGATLSQLLRNKNIQ